MTRMIVFILGIVFFQHCFTFNPRSSQLSLVIISASLEKDEPFLDEFISPRFHKVTLKKGDIEFTYSEKSGHYFYFQNLSPGQYELGNLVHYLESGNGGHPLANNSRPQVIEPPLTREDRLKTVVNVEPGSIVFLGEIQVNAKLRTREPIDIQGNFNKGIEAEKRALNYLVRNYPRSGWAYLAKDRLKSLNVISLD